MSFVESAGVRVNDYFSRLEVDDEDGNEFTDRWNTGELLCLASSVQRSGDKNWVSVSRSIKPFGDPKKPPDWYTPKNCALQYSKLLKGVEDFKKKSLPRTERETSEELLIKNLTDKRITELNWLNQQTKAVANSLKVTMELLEHGEFDDHLDELLKQIEEQEKKDEEDFREWTTKRESLNAAKRLNKCRVPLSKGKAPSRGLDTKRKNSPNPDQIDDVTIHPTVPDIIIKTEPETDHEFTVSSKPIHIKTEIVETPVSTLLDCSKAATIVPPSPSSTAPTSPLLTSLLRSVASNNSGAPVVSYVSTPLKEIDSSSILDGKSTELDMAALIAKSQETPPRASVPQSPRPTPASSPLLNSLLKNTPSSSPLTSPLTSIQLSQTKEGSTLKSVSSPQSFFNPTSALATAAAQQLAVATSAVPQSPVFFPHLDSAESRKMPLQSPATSACLSAPTLSKLLEMPPSTPGRLPPLPVVDTVAISSTASVTTVTTAEQVITPSPVKSTTAMLLSELELQISSVSPSPQKKSVENKSAELPTIPEQSESNKNSDSLDKNLSTTVNTVDLKAAVEEQKKPVKSQEIDPTSKENIQIIEAVYKSITQAFDDKPDKENADTDSSNQNKSKKAGIDSLNVNHSIDTDKSIPDDVLNAAINIEKLISSDIGLDDKVFSEDINDTSDLNLFEDDKQKSSDMEIETSPDLQIPESIVDIDDEDKMNGRKFYKSRILSKKRPSVEEETEKSSESSPSKTVQKKQNKLVKSDPETLPPIPVNEQLLQAAKEAEEATMNKTPEKSPSKEIRSPVAKKPRLFEKMAPKEKKELSEDDIPIAKRSGRKAKKGRKMSKFTPVKQDEPKDQYEFSESTEENSVGYQAANTLCYMPRLKDDARFDESKLKHLQSQSVEDTIVAPSTGSVAEKKHVGTPVKNKHGKSPHISTTRKALFTSDEERMSDSVTSDDASNSNLGDDKLKKWKELNDNKDGTKDSDETAKVSQKVIKDTDAHKKKPLQTKRNLFKSDTPTKEKKVVGSDVEESSACSRDSEDAAGTTSWQRDDAEASDRKDQSPNETDDVEIEANDSHMSSSVTAESDKQIDEVEGYESLPGSVTTGFSPLPQSEVKEEKDVSQFGKQDWFQGASPKSSEPVSQSSEESEYESDNWDSQSVSTNKSATHSAGQSSRTKRKERESPQYKAWKKAISIVLREASCHKYANVFLQKVTNDVAPGYLSIVYRPMDLSLLKKNVDNGVVKTTAEVHRDMLLMFQNAVMYNSSDHDVHHMAVEMQRDVIQQIQAFLTTQFNDKDESSEPTSLRGARSAKSQKVYASSSKLKEETHEKE